MGEEKDEAKKKVERKRKRLIKDVTKRLNNELKEIKRTKLMIERNVRFSNTDKTELVIRELKYLNQIRQSQMQYKVLQFLFNQRPDLKDTLHDDGVRNRILTKCAEVMRNKNVYRQYELSGVVPPLDDYVEFDQMKSIFFTRKESIYPAHLQTLFTSTRVHPIQVLAWAFRIDIMKLYNDTDECRVSYGLLIKFLHEAIWGDTEEAREASLVNVKDTADLIGRLESRQQLRKTAALLLDEEESQRRRQAIFHERNMQIGFHYPTLDFAAELDHDQLVRWRNFKLEQLSPANLHKYDDIIEKVFPGGINQSGILVTHEERFMIKLSAMMQEFKELSNEDLEFYDTQNYKARLNYRNRKDPQVYQAHLTQTR